MLTADKPYLAIGLVSYPTKCLEKSCDNSYSLSTAMAVRMGRAEVDEFFSKLVQFLRENEKYLSQEACRDRFNALRGDDKSTLERLAGMLRRRRRRKLPESIYDDDDNNNGDDGSLEHDTSEHDSVSNDSDRQSEEESDLHAKETNPSEDESNVTENGSLSGTNFKNSSVTIRRPLCEILRRCKRDQKAFFEELHQNLPTSGGFGVSFCRIRQTGQRSDLLAIYKRFDLRNLYLRAVHFGYHTGKSWRWNARKQLAAEIKDENPRIPTSLDQISEELHYYVELGRGYEAWVEKLGHPGYLIALPLDVSETE